MAGDSVGKIQLDLEVVSDLSKQIGAVSKSLGQGIKSSIEGATSGAFEGMNKKMDSTMKQMTSSVKTSASKMTSNLKSMFSNAFEALKNIKLPTVKFSKPTASKAPVTPIVSNAAQPRAPTGGNTGALSAQIQNTAASLDNVNARIEQQQAKLAGLKESLNSTFNPATKNKLEEQILKTEAAINKLIGASDKLGFKLADLDAKFAGLNSSQGVGAVAGMVNETAKMTGTSAGATKTTNAFSEAMKKLGGSTRSAGNSMNSYHMGLANTLNQMFKWMIILPMIVKGLGAMATYVGQSLMTNAQFANSLAQIKTNLMVAFTPIFYAVLPAINALMSALATITTYIAMFTSALFGKTYTQSMKATQGLIDAKTAMGYYGEAAKKAGKNSKEALGSLAGFDEINILNSNKNKEADTGAGAGGGPKVPKLVAPPIDTTPTAGIIAAAEALKRAFATLFNPLKAAWAKDGAGVMAALRKAFDATVLTVKHFFDVLATPSMQLFMENVWRLVFAIIKLGLRIYTDFILPIVNWFISLLPGAADGLNPILEAVRNFVDYLSGDGFGAVQAFLSVLLGLFVGIKTFKVVSSVVSFFSTLGFIIMNITKVLQGLWIIMMANPIALVVAVIAGLVAAFIALYTTNETFRNKMNEIGAFLSNTFGPIINVIASIVRDVLGIAFNVVVAIAKDFWQNVLVPLGNFLKDVFVKIIQSVIEIYNAWKPAIDNVVGVLMFLWNNVLKPLQIFIGGIFISVFYGVFKSIGDVIGNLKTIFFGIIDFITGVLTGNWAKAWQGIVQIFGGIFGGIVSIAKAPINALIGLINGAISGINEISVDIPDWVPKFGGTHFGVSLPHIPYLAKGGIIDQPTLAMVGESGKEAVMPLENNTGWINDIANKLNGKVQGSDEVVTVLRQIYEFLKNMSIDIYMDDTRLGKLIIDSINSANRRAGKSLIR